MTTVNIAKGEIGEQDLQRVDGVTGTFIRQTSNGGTLTLNKIGYEIDALSVFGNFANYTKATIDSAINAIGSSTATLLLRPGNWLITADTTVPDNITLKVPAGATLTISSGKTLTLSDPSQIDIGPYYYNIFAGSGNVAITGGSTYTPASTLTAAVLKALAMPYATAAEITTGTEAAKSIAPDQLKLAGFIPASISNLELVVNAAVNKLDVFARSSGTVPSATNVIRVEIPDGNGNVTRARSAAYLSGTSQFIMADGANYWSKGSLDAEIKTACVYAIWDANGGIVWALGGYSGFARCPSSTTATDDDFFLLEASSTYTKATSDYCVCVGKIRYQYDTGDTPDHTIQATVLDSPRIIWNPRSDYGYQKSLAVTVTSESDIVEYSVLSLVAKQSGKYFITGQSAGSTETNGNTDVYVSIAVGSGTYGSATKISGTRHFEGIANQPASASTSAVVYVNAGDTIHLGVGVSGNTNTRSLFASDWIAGVTSLAFQRID